MPTFSFPAAPPNLTAQLLRRLECSPTDRFRDPTASALRLMPDYHPRPAARLVSCYALFR